MAHSTCYIKGPNAHQITHAIQKMVADMWPEDKFTAVIGGEQNSHIALCEYIIENPSLFEHGLLPFAATIAVALPLDLVSQLCEEGGVVLKATFTDQERYNGVDIDLVIGDYEVDVTDDCPDRYSTWMDNVCGDMLHDRHDLLIIAIFGTKIDPSIQKWLLDGKLTIDGFTRDQIVAIFTDYPNFVNNVLNGISTHTKLFNIEFGSDS